jgi:catechol 2,3-dioxygenase-like lactoylglutathione lyase family enzyme
LLAIDDKRSHAYAEVVIHHVGVEVEQRDVERSVSFWELLGFERVEPPAALARFTWLERGGTQIHLLPAEAPTVPSAAHVAVVVPDFEGALAALTEAGFEVDRRNEYWGAPRAKATAPGGHVVELMAAPPAPAE